MRALAALACVLMLGAGRAHAQSPAPVQGPADLYFLSIGIGNHVDPDFSGLNASRNSARVVANALIEAGARHGIVLTSTPGTGETVTREDVREALVRLKSRIRADDARAPRVIVYVMSHGLGDPASDYLFLAPDNLLLAENPVGQELVFRLGRRSILNIDLLASMMGFRGDERFEHLDDVFESDLMPDRLGLAGTIEYGRNQMERSRELDRYARSYGSEPFDNAPIPFVILLDNCADGLMTNLVEKNPALDRLVGAQYRATLDIGRIFYAVAPGMTASPLPLPDDLTSEADRVPGPTSTMEPPVVGPMAVHLKIALRSRDAGAEMTLRAFAEAVAASGSDDLEGDLPPRPHMPDVPMRPDVARAAFIPAGSIAGGDLVEMSASNSGLVQCCGVID